MSDTQSHAPRQNGLSLIELMVSILLGVILSSGIIAVYLESKRNYAAEEELARIQENGRFALDLLKREFSMAGFYGGYFLADDLPAVAVSTDCSTNWALDVVPPVELVNDNTGTFLTGEGTTLDCGLANVKSGTDIVTIKRAAARATVYEGALVNGAQLDPNEWYLKVEGYGESKEWFNESSFGALDPNTVEYWEIYAKIYYIRDYSTNPGDGIPTLCVKSLSDDGMTDDRCIVEGIEDMQIEFGVDTNGDSVPNTYTPDPNDMSVAVTARIYLLVRSLGELYSTENVNTKEYQLGLDASDTFTPAGNEQRYLRQIFSTTVLVRNAILPAT